MSAVGFIATSNLIIALSDGLEVHSETFERVGENTKKVYKISDQTLLVSCGNIIKIGRIEIEIPKFIQNKAYRLDVTDPVGVANLLRDHTENAPKEATRLNYNVMGFDDSGTMRRFHFTNSERGGEEKPISSGMVGVMAHECDDLAQKMFQRLLNQKFKGGRLPLLVAAKQAWTETIRHYEDEYLFGGKIFMETVRSK